MTYPPPGGNDPQHFQLQPEPSQQPSDPYSQGYNSAPPSAPNYFDPNAPQYGQQPPPPHMTPPVGVQPGYPQGAPSALPPQLPQQKHGGNLGIILVIVVGLVAVLGVAAVMLIPGILDEGEDQGGGSTVESESPSEEESEEPSEEPTEEEPTEDEEEEDPADDFDTWGTASSSEDFDVNSPEGAAIAWKWAYDTGDAETMESLICSDASDYLVWQYEHIEEYGGSDPGYPVWGMAREVDGAYEAWAGWTYTDAKPTEDDLSLGYIYEVVEEDGTWKVCDYS
ncbi:hypothetical protein [Glycomyces buryatensis]|uniref:Uncharacterized protein n=1 Tax=Glycomyces buryatensis TaxID=2570927 RepID=A0A4S8QCX6_9ACTN|nr:hypothetical protein [Glycomyces buryatensis]THV41441.1 hypothetical protein FAB82_11625 [Glycomyces buryatensis]